jgi:malate synthase
LRREAYTPERLDAQLDEATQAFLLDPTRNHLDAQPVALSRIFEWFAADFINNAGSVAAFVRRFVPENKRVRLNLTDSELRYLEYDWTLNAQEGQRVS